MQFKKHQTYYSPSDCTSFAEFICLLAIYIRKM